MRVVLPEPVKPVRTVMGIRFAMVCIFCWAYRLAWIIKLKFRDLLFGDCYISYMSR